MEQSDILGMLVGQLSQHPELLKGALGMLGGLGGAGEKEGTNEQADDPPRERADDPAGETERVALPTAAAGHRRADNREILKALKPYLNDRRREVVERVIRASDLINLLRGGK